MSFSDSFRRRMESNGVSESDGIKNSTFEFANANFSNAPNYRKVLLNGEDFDVRVLDGKTDGLKTFLLRPGVKIPIGSYIDYDSNKWLITDLNGELISPKASAEVCNGVLRWKDSEGILYQIPSSVFATRNTKFDIVSGSMQVEMLQGGMYAYIPYNQETKKIKTSHRFILGDYVYEVTGFDDLSRVSLDRVGVVQLTLRITTEMEGDDFTIGLANNEILYENHEGIGDSGGGGIW